MTLWEDNALKDTFYHLKTGGQGSYRIKTLFEQFFFVNSHAHQYGTQQTNKHRYQLHRPFV